MNATLLQNRILDKLALVEMNQKLPLIDHIEISVNAFMVLKESSPLGLDEINKKWRFYGYFMKEVAELSGHEFRFIDKEGRIIIL